MRCLSAHVRGYSPAWHSVAGSVWESSFHFDPWTGQPYVQSSVLWRRECRHQLRFKHLKRCPANCHWALSLSYLHLSAPSKTGAQGVYVGSNAPSAPTCTVSFSQTDFNNTQLGTADLTAGSTGLLFIASADNTLPAHVSQGAIYAIVDLNRDGIPDLVIASPSYCVVANCFHATA